jgi:hypothetical protein
MEITMAADDLSALGASSDVDLTFRPASYFRPQRLTDQVTSKITGSVRRRLVQEALDAGEDVPPALLEGTLDEETLDAITGFHPALLGGEFLPRQQRGEVEIARISLESTTSDQVVLRARRSGARLRYTVEDEYEGEYVDPAYRPRSSTRPLTLGQLVSLIDSAYDVFDVIRMNLDGGSDVRDMASFVAVTSEFYPQLESLYERRIAAWLAENYAPDEAENEPDADADEEADEG